MAKITAKTALDMGAFSLDGDLFGEARTIGRRKVVYEGEEAKVTLRGDFDRSHRDDAPSGTLDSFVYARNGRTELKIAKMDLSLDALFALGGGADAEAFFGALLDGGDRVFGSRSADALSGFGGADRLFGRAGADVLNGGDGDDRLFGGAGDDTLLGGDRRDKLKGGAGDDVLNGGQGKDVLFGGKGADLFEFDLGFGEDRIKDFKLAQGDRIDLGSLLDDAGAAAGELVRDHARIAKGGVVLDFGDGDVLRIDGLRDIDALIETGLAGLGDDLIAG